MSLFALVSLIDDSERRVNVDPRFIEESLDIAFNFLVVIHL